MKPGMRIGPFEFLHGSRKRHGLFMIEHGEGMMCKRRACECGNRACKDSSFELHGILPARWLRVFDCTIVTQNSRSLQGGTLASSHFLSSRGGHHRIWSG